MSKNSQMSAMDRINALLDEGSFVEIGANVTKRNTDFNLSDIYHIFHKEHAYIATS